MKFKKGDTVKIISGNDKGKTGKILSVFPAEGKIVVENAQVRKKHVRARQQGKKGEMVHIPAPFPASRAMIVCSRCAKPTRIGLQIGGNAKMRMCKKCGSAL